MKTDYVNVVLLGLTDELVNVCVVNAELALWAACNYLVSFAGAKIWIESYKDFLVSQFVFESSKSLECSNIENNSLFEGIIDLFFTYKVFSV